MNELIEAAKLNSRKPKPFDKQELELALAWLRGEVTSTGVRLALGRASTAEMFVGAILKRAYALKAITVTINPD